MALAGKKRFKEFPLERKIAVEEHNGKFKEIKAKGYTLTILGKTNEPPEVKDVELDTTYSDYTFYAATNTEGHMFRALIAKKTGKLWLWGLESVPNK